MFEVAELGHKVSKQEFDGKAPELHTNLLKIQRELQKSKQSLIIIVSGVEGAGKGDVVNRLNEWLDSRGMKTTAFWDETDEQAMRPRYWRFWRTMPPRGTIGIMFGSWYTKPIIDRVYDNIDEAEYERRLQEIVEFERMLSAENVIFVKLWFHLAKEKVQKNLKQDAKTKKVKLRNNPYNTKFSKEFDQFLKVSEVAIRSTDKGDAPWHVVEASDPQYRDLLTGQIILEALQNALAVAAETSAAALPVSAATATAAMTAAAPATAKAVAKTPAKKAARTVAKTPAKQKASDGLLTVLDAIDLTRKLQEDDYKQKLEKWQLKLQALSWQAREQRRSVVIVFEGWDAAGKGSTIRRLTQAIDARLYQVISSAAPTDEEAAQHYLWRFWRHLPMAGYLSIYDRSWYGRVLVERVEKITAEERWKRGYTEINLFEQQLSEHGIIVLKFWLHLSPEEQLRRFKEREKTPWKQHKISEDDWRNRDKWNDYKLAINDMVAHTSTSIAPWHLVAAEDKKFGRIDVLKTVCRTLKKALKDKK